MIHILTAYTLLSVGILSNKYVVRFMAPALFVALRMLASAGILMVYNHRQVDKLKLSHIPRHLGNIVYISLCTTFLPAYLKAWSLQKMLVSKQTLLGSVDPLVTAIIAYYMLDERLTVRKALGIALGMVGVACIVLWDIEEQAWSSIMRIDMPELAILAAIVLSRFGWTQVQRLLHAEHYTPVQLNILVQLSSGLISLVFWALTQSPTDCFVQPCEQQSYLALALFLTIIGGNVIGYTIYTRCLKMYPATLMSVAGMCIPVMVTLGAYVIYGERMTGGMVLGALAIGAGIVVFNSQALLARWRAR